MEKLHVFCLRYLLERIIEPDKTAGEKTTDLEDGMADFSLTNTINPYVRMMRLKRSTTMSGKWKDIDNVFTYIASGKADFIVEGVKYSLMAGDVIIMPPYKTHVIVSQGEESLVQYIMHFDFYEDKKRIQLLHKDILEDENYMECISEKEKRVCPEVLFATIPEGERNDLVRRYLSMLHEFKEERPGKELMIKADCTALLVSAFRNVRDAGLERSGQEPKKTKAWLIIERAIEYINRKGVYDTPDNQVIADALEVSPNYLTKIFQDYLGIPLHRYVMNLKVEKVQQYLLTGKVNITEAARMAGFSSIHVMSKTFKKYLGISPSEFVSRSVNRESLVENKFQEQNTENLSKNDIRRNKDVD